MTHRLHIEDLRKARKKVRVKGTLKRKAHTRMMEVGVDTISNTYYSVPSQVELNADALKQVSETAILSQSMDKEISSAIHSQEGKMTLGPNEVGEKDSCVLKAGALGNFHTHPGVKGECVDSFSLMDLIITVDNELPLMMAHTCYNGRTWIAIPSSETKETKGKDAKLDGWYSLSYQEDSATANRKVTEKHYRGLVRSFCEEFKVSLFCGKKGTLKEYDGTW